MYSVSDDYLTKIVDTSRTVSWYGTITLTSGTVVSFDTSTIASGGISVEKDLFSDENPGIGNTCSGELRLNLYTDIDRYLLYGAEVVPYFRLYLTSSTYEDIPLGVFFVSEATRTSNMVSMVCYDAMMDFDVAASTNTSGNPYDVLNLACTVCGVTFGNTQAQIEAMTNGTTAISSYVGDKTIGTWRQVVGYVAEFLGGNAVIDTSGALVILPYESGTSVRTYSQSERFSSDIADFGVYVSAMTYVDGESGEVHSYASSTESGSDYVGYEIELGINPFIPLDSDGETGTTAMNAVFTAISAIQTIPFEITIPVDPSIEVGDFITLTGGQVDSVLCIVDNITYKSSGSMTISGCGENPDTTATAAENTLSAIDNSVDNNATYYYDYISAAEISISDGSYATIFDVAYSSTTDTHINYHGQVYANVTTTETYDSTTDMYTYDDCVVTATYYIDGEAQTFQPQWTLADGENTIDLFYFYDVSEAGGGQFTASLSCSGGSLVIATGNSRGYIEGSDFDKYYLGIYIETLPDTTTFLVGDTYDWTGLVVKGILNTGTEVDITSACTISPSDGTTATTEGTITVSISYTDSKQRIWSESFSVTVEENNSNFLTYCEYTEYDDYYLITGLNLTNINADHPTDINIPSTYNGKYIVLE